MRIVTRACGPGYRISAPAGLKSKCGCASPSLARQANASKRPC